MNFQPCIRYCGGKRRQSEDIIARMPKEMKTFYIPFLGSGAVMFQLINSNIKYENIVASDIYQPLMGIWDIVQNNPDRLIDSYIEMFDKFEDIGEPYYYEVVDEFNKQKFGSQSPEMFYFITRACMRGNLEYDRNGNFVTKVQRASSQDGIAEPRMIKPIIRRWHEKIQDVEFRCEPYDCIAGEVEEGDFCFFDPPYIDGTWYHDNQIDMDKFYDFLRCLPCDYSITLNGDRDIYPIPEDCYTKHEYVYYGVKKSASGRPIGSRDSLWMKMTDMYEYTDGRENVRNTQRGNGGTIPKVTDLKVMGDIQKQIDDTNDRIDDMNDKLDMILSALCGKQTT